MIYRDKKTGRFAAKSTWTRSKAQGGTRYVRQGVSHGKAGVKPGVKGERPLPGAPAAIRTAKDYADAYDDFEDYEDQGEIETGVDY